MIYYQAHLQMRLRQALGMRGGIEYPFRCEPVTWDSHPRKQLSLGSRLKDSRLRSAYEAQLKSHQQYWWLSQNTSLVIDWFRAGIRSAR